MHSVSIPAARYHIVRGTGKGKPFLTQLWQTLLRSAICTPSPHNTQPWRVRILDQHHATLYMERARMLPDEDLTGHFLRCAMGMFLESLTIVSANNGFTLRYELLKQNAFDALIPFANLELVPGAEPSAYSLDLVHHRVTSRLPSNGDSIDPELSAKLQRFEPRHGQKYTQIDARGMIETIMQENITAVFHDLNVPAYRDQMSRWIRLSDQEAQQKADGLDYRCMRTSPLQMKLMKRWPQLLRRPITGGLMRRRYRRQIGAITHLGIISGPFFDDAASVSAGTFLMRFWLELASHGLQIHPFSNLVTNPRAKARLRALTRIDEIWLVFRIGYTDQPPRSYRRPVEEVMVSALPG